MKKISLIAAMCILGGASAFGEPTYTTEIPFTVVPNNKLPQTEISHIEVCFPPINVVEMLVLAEGVTLEIKCPYGEELEVNGDWIDYDAGQVLGFDLPEPLTEAGHYKFVIDYGIYNEDAQTFIEPVEFEYDIIAPVEDVLTVNPAPGAYSSLSGLISLTPNGGYSFGENPKVEIEGVSDNTTKELPLTVSGGVATIDLGTEGLSQDSYIFTLPQGTLVPETGNSEKIEWTYIIPSFEYTITPDPEQAVSRLWDIHVTFPQANRVDIATNSDGIKLFYPDGEVVDAIPFTISNYLYFRVDANIMDNGKYRFEVPAGTLSVDGVPYDEEIAVYFYKGVSGVEEITMPGEEGTVYYNLNGIRVKPEEAKRGIFIMKNSKGESKTIIR